MKAKLIKFWSALRASFWFLPALMAAGAIALALTTVALEKQTQRLSGWAWAYSGGAEGASTLLGAIAGSMITIAGVVFSMTLVALSLASSQLGPRLLRNFMRDTTNQVVLGTFIATFLYCLLILRTIRHEQADIFVPHLSVTVGVLLALVSVGVLIYFIHHVSVSIQADQVVGRVGDELVAAIHELFPEQLDAAARPEPADPDPVDGFDQDAHPVVAVEDGYLQVIDGDALLAVASEHDLVLRVGRRAGHYIVAGSALVLAWPRARVNDEIAAQIASAFALGRQRTEAQDLEFTVTQLVEIAVRALSPGVNDPFTAIACVDRLSSALSHLVRRVIPSSNLRDGAGRLRVIVPPIMVPAVMDASFHMIRQSARSSAAVTIRLLDAIAVIARFVRRPDDRNALLRHAVLIARGAREALPEENDRRTVEDRYQTAVHALHDGMTAWEA